MTADNALLESIVECALEAAQATTKELGRRSVANDEWFYGSQSVQQLLTYLWFMTALTGALVDQTHFDAMLREVEHLNTAMRRHRIPRSSLGDGPYG